jgi:ParB family chromosome partitioning protein
VILPLVASGDLSAGHARTLLGCKRREDMILLSERAVEFGLSVRQLEEEVKRINKPKKEVVEEPVPFVDYFRELELRVQSHLGRRVKIEEKGRKKTISLFYEDNEDLDEILTLLCGKDFLDQI